MSRGRAALDHIAISDGMPLEGDHPFATANAEPGAMLPLIHVHFVRHSLTMDHLTTWH
jgi:hypothetical protein